MTDQPIYEERVRAVSATIRDLSPHQAARNIDNLYQRWFRLATTMEYQVMFDRPTGRVDEARLRRAYVGTSLKHAKHVVKTLEVDGYEAWIEQRYVSHWKRR